jgi:general secretion pathway protein G
MSMNPGNEQQSPARNQPDPPEGKIVTPEQGEIVFRVESLDAPPPLPIDYATPEPGQHPVRIVLQIAGVVFALLLVAALVVFLRPISARPNAPRITAAKTDVANFQVALDAFEIDTNRLPTQAEGLQALVLQPSSAAGWHGPYVKMVPTDPWGKPYNYIIPGKHNPKRFDLWSNGPDSKSGTRDDIGNW